MMAGQMNMNPTTRSEISFNLSEAGDHNTYRADHEKDLMNMGLNIVPLDAN